MGSRLRTVGAVAGLVVMLGACASGARTTGPYTAKAANAADAVHSAVASDLLLIQAVRRGHTIAPYVSVGTSEAEDDATSAASSFLSIQPPSDDAKGLRDMASQLFNDAQSALADARIAGRRGDNDALLASARDLRQIAQELQHFIDEHQ